MWYMPELKVVSCNDSNGIRMIVVRKEIAPNEGPDIEPNPLTSTTFKIENFCGKNMYQQFKDEKFCDVTLAAGASGKR